MKYEMMLRILFYLLARGKTSGSALASRFGISQRSVMRYVDEISLAGIPIISDPGRNGGYYIAESYKITDGFMTKDEFDAILAAANACNERLGDKNLTTAIDKLKSVYRPNSANIDLKAGNFLIDFSNWNGSDNAKEIISVMENAIEKERTVSVKYVDRNGNQSVREIEPHVIVMKQGLWYVYAFCRTRNEFRTFKISRITYAHETENPFKKREFDPAALTTLNHIDDGETVFVDMEIEKNAVTEVEEWLGVESVYMNSQGRYAASCKLPLDSWLVSKITSYGGRVRVTAPEELKTAIANHAREILAQYEN